MRLSLDPAGTRLAGVPEAAARRSRPRAPGGQERRPVGVRLDLQGLRVAARDHLGVDQHRRRRRRRRAGGRSGRAPRRRRPGAPARPPTSALLRSLASRPKHSTPMAGIHLRRVDADVADALIDAVDGRVDGVAVDDAGDRDGTASPRPRPPRSSPALSSSPPNTRSATAISRNRTAPMPGTRGPNTR